jgi:phage terminase large subunit-like protein
MADIEDKAVSGAVVKPVIFKDKDTVKFLRDCAQLARKHDVRSVMVITVTGEDYVDWMHMAESDLHLALIGMTLEDARNDLKSELFKEYLDE